jgi:hypothetical protein
MKITIRSFDETLSLKLNKNYLIDFEHKLSQKFVNKEDLIQLFEEVEEKKRKIEESRLEIRATIDNLDAEVSLKIDQCCTDVIGRRFKIYDDTINRF